MYDLTFKTWLIESNIEQKTLYHGTIIDNLDSIKRHGLVPGDIEDQKSFVYDAYSSSFEDEDTFDQYVKDKEIPVFLTDKEELDRAITAMKFHISKKLGLEHLGYVTDNHIRNHGLLVIIRNHSALRFNYKDHEMQDEFFGLEDGDYFSQGEIATGFLYGNKLVKFLNKLGHETIPDEKWRKKLQGWKHKERL